MDWCYAFIICLGLAQVNSLQNRRDAKEDIVLKNVLSELNRMTRVLSQQEHNIKEHDKQMKEQERKIAEQGVLIKAQDRNIEMMQGDIKHQEIRLNDRIKEQETINKELAIRIQHQDTLIEDQANTIKLLDKSVEPTYDNYSEINDKIHFSPVSPTGLVTGFACDLDILTLACTDGKDILVESAHYGQYSQTCSDTCCPPHPLDCTESMEENAPVDWYALKTLCDNTTSCEFQNPGRDVPSCAEPYSSDYALVYYSCQPEDKRAPSAFTAATDTTRSYSDGDVVIFDVVLTNVGNNYLADTSTYVCPMAGVYVFSVTLMNDYGDYMYAELMLEGTEFVHVYCDSATNHQGAMTVVIECDRGERVWVRSGGSTRIGDDSNTNYNAFSGHILHTY